MKRALCFFVTALLPSMASAGAYIFADATRLDSVTHARVYTGVGGVLATPLTVCIDISVNPELAAQAEGSVIKAVNTYNRLRSIPNNNLAFGANTDIPAGQVDFESTLLHEMGHCQGLAHPNHATESGIVEPGRNGTKSSVGANAVFDQNAGADTRHGSSDDVRSDDLNLHWYIRNQNNPGVLPALFDTTTLIRDLTALPVGHLFAANADRDVLNALGFANTEAVMQQGAFFEETQRILQHDDVTTLRLARAGVDRIAGNADDYSYQLQYVGQLNNPADTACNLRVRIDASTGFAVCSVGGAFIGSTSNVRVTTANLAFNDATAWYFSPAENTVTQIVGDAPDPSVTGQSYTAQVTVTEAAGITIAGQPSGTVEVSDGLSGLCTITLVESVGEIGSCVLPASAPGARNLSARYLGFAGWDSSGGTATHSINKANTTLSISDAPDPAALGANVTITANLSVVAPGLGTPGGTISVTATNSTGCSITLPALSCVLTFTASGGQTINASYAGDSQFNGSTAAAIAHTTSGNSPPTISTILNLAINEDGNTGALTFTVGDAETPVADLTLSAASTNTALVPIANIVFGGSGANRTVTVTPAANQFGASTITVTVTDANSGIASEPFLLSVLSQNDLPTITAIADQTINEDGNTGALGFTVADIETAASSLTLLAASTNTGLVPVANVVFGGSGASRTVTVTPAANQSGTATITVTVTDADSGTASEPFLLTVTAQNDLPTITAIADQTINEDGNTGALGFTVVDIETAAGSLTLSAASTNTGLVPIANIVFGGSGASRTVTVTPTANQSGTSTITVTVTDANSGTVSEPFLLTVNAVNDPPSVSSPGNQLINEDGATALLSVTVGDIETAAASLTMTAVSTNTALIPNAAIVLGGSGANRTVQVTPAANLSGSSTITLTLTDAGTATGTAQFDVVVTAVNDAPSFVVQGNQNPAAGSLGLQTVAGFVTAINFGPNEAGQAVATYVVDEVNDPSNIVSAASISNTGTLSYTLSGPGGSATLSATLRDNAGTANGGVDTSAPIQFDIVVIATADLSVSKTNLATTLIENGTTRYTVEVRNDGFNAAPASLLTDPVPMGLSNFTWTCAGAAGASCPLPSGSGAISTLVDMPVGGLLTYTVDATVTASAGQTVSNIASIQTGTVQELDNTDNTVTDSDLVVLDTLFLSGFE